MSHGGKAVSALCLATTFGAFGCGSPNAPGVSIVAAQPALPQRGTIVPYYNQPITLVVTPTAATGSTTPTTVLEVSTDAAFVSIQTARPIPSGQTQVALDHLEADTKYYWRAKTSVGGDSPAYSPSSLFTVGPKLVIQAPTPVQPLSNSLAAKRPAFVVKNATYAGPATSLTYTFDVATDPDFESIITTATIAEGTAQTEFVPNLDLVSGATYFWRARVSDLRLGVSSSYSVPQSFATTFPDDGNYRYKLSLDIPGQCLRNRTSVEPPPGGHVFTFDDNLSIVGSTVKFSLRDLPPVSVGPLPGLALRLQRSGNTINGVIGGSALHPDRYAFQTIIITLGAPLLSYVIGTNTIEATGTTVNDGVFRGSFDGPVFFWDTFDTGIWCSGRQVGWTLTPFGRP